MIDALSAILASISMSFSGALSSSFFIVFTNNPLIISHSSTFFTRNNLIFEQICSYLISTAAFGVSFLSVCWITSWRDRLLV